MQCDKPILSATKTDLEWPPQNMPEVVENGETFPSEPDTEQ